jgi:hypothetical protein
MMWLYTITICLLCSRSALWWEFHGSYLQYNTKVLKLIFLHDEISNYQINSVYIPYVNMNNFFIDQFGTFDYKHANSILVTTL